MDTTNLCCLLLDTDHFMVRKILVEDNKLCLILQSTAHQAACPNCKVISTEVHSTYLRYPVDLAWAEWQVEWHLQVKRFFCRNDRCSKRTFAERFPGILPPYARQTKRLKERQKLVGMNLCARSAEKLLRVLQIGISDTTINRWIRAHPDPDELPVRVLGVDDWAKRKGQTYGTILVDLERRMIIDLLADREADTLAQWLSQHQGIEIVTRDRSRTYTKAIDQAVPKAVQVADRWHLLKNLSDTLFKILQQEYATLKKRYKKLQKHPQNAQILEKRAEISPTEDESEQLTPSEQRRKESMEKTARLVQLGWTQKAIARELDLHPKTIHRYLQRPTAKVRRPKRKQQLDPFKPYILKRWGEGCNNAAQLFREIKLRGYPGGLTMLQDFTKSLRQNGTTSAMELNPSLPSPRTLIWWILKEVDEQNEDQKKMWADLICDHPRLEATTDLANEFAEMVRERKPEILESWLQKASGSGYRSWRNFADSLKQDLTAVQAALTLDWSNGPTEGHVNRLKCLKRQMYGRAKDDLLRKRALWQGRWSFT